MPLYTYQCTSCNTREDVLEQVQTTHEPKLCPKCGKQTFQRIISPGTAFHLKGDGWYQTDFK